MAAHFQKGPHETRQLLKKEIGKQENEGEFLLI